MCSGCPVGDLEVVGVAVATLVAVAVVDFLMLPAHLVRYILPLLGEVHLCCSVVPKALQREHPVLKA